MQKPDFVFYDRWELFEILKSNILVITCKRIIKPPRNGLNGARVDQSSFFSVVFAR
jgi:hypothetical protein